MDIQHAFAISAAGMDLERTRVDVAALNLANAHTVLGADGRNYQPMRVVARPGLGAPGFANLVASGLDALPAAEVVPTGAAATMSYDPSHPLADARGFVSYPGVDTASEMLNIMSAMRGYEANVAAMNASRTLALKALDIGGNS
jgi:flagellar basal-body rod protein FlgC